MQLHKLAVGGLVMGLAMSAGIAYATIPDSGGVIHGCYKTAAAANGTHGLKVIDSATTPTCPTGYTNLNWPTQGTLLTEGFQSFSGPYTTGQTVATFTVPAGLMCVSAAASAFSTSSQSTMAVLFTSTTRTVPIAEVQVFTNEANSHKAMVPFSINCAAVAAGTYTYKGIDFSGATSSNVDDIGSLTVQVFSN